MTIFASLEWTNFSHRRWVEGIGGRGGSKISEQLFFCMSYKKWMPALSKKWVSAQSKLPNSDVQNISCENWNQIISGYLCMENHRWIARKLDKCDICPNQCSTILTTGCWERLETLYLAYVFYSTLPPPLCHPIFLSFHFLQFFLHEMDEYAKLFGTGPTGVFCHMTICIEEYFNPMNSQVLSLEKRFAVIFPMGKSHRRNVVFESSKRPNFFFHKAIRPECP